ncbi:hypothetical protein MPSEU_000005100 [Mayamaea pseudoterrestris]|nr:hypothetical protein MPSEU_000005100 [Mayamaea pseudoterrestris]
MPDEEDLQWKKPDWATSGPKLKSTGKNLKGGENLAKPITNLPHMKGEDQTNFEAPKWTADVQPSDIPSNLAKEITSATSNASLAFEKPDWTKERPVKQSEKGAALKEGKEIARPIGGIKPVED